MGMFKRVGAEVAFGESVVELSDIQPIHDAVLGNLFLAARAPQIEFSADRDAVAYSMYLHPEEEFTEGQPDCFVSAQVAHESVPDSWRLALSVRTFMRNNRHSNKLIRYRFEVLDGEPMEAKKAVYMVLGSAAMHITPDGDLSETVVTERKMFERQLQPADCRQIVEQLQQTVNRVSV